MHAYNENYRLPPLALYTNYADALIVRVNRQITLAKTKDGAVYNVGNRDFDLLSPYNGTNKEVRAAACKLLGITQKSLIGLRRKRAEDQAERDRKHQIERLKTQARKLGLKLESQK